MTVPIISYLSNVHFAPGAVRMLPQLLGELKVTRPLLVTDRGLVSLGVIDRLGIHNGVVFDRVQANPTEQDVLAGLGMYREEKCDGVVAVGGGSPMDCAKCVALLATHAPPLEQYAFVRGGITKITGAKPPVVCVPTTAGTGSEVGRAALVVMNSGPKLAVLSPKLLPEAVVCDPELTLALPPKLTAATGMDALSHCVETFCSPRFNPVAEAIALDGLSRAWQHIRRAVDSGSDIAARGEMMMAALEGGMTFQKGLGAVHSLSHAVGSLKKPLHHGTLNAIFLPHVLRFNARACPEKMRRLGETIGLTPSEDLSAAFEKLSREIGLPSRLHDLGVEPTDFAGLPELAVLDHCTATNPVAPTEAEYQKLLETAL